MKKKQTAKNKREAKLLFDELMSHADEVVDGVMSAIGPVGDTPEALERQLSEIHSMMNRMFSGSELPQDSQDRITKAVKTAKDQCMRASFPGLFQ